MSVGPRPPVPGLIPLAALSRRPPGRPRRRPAESIDADAGSRCEEKTRAAAAPGRRRHHHHRRRAAASAVGKQSQSRSSSPALERPPRVNPIFVWVRQEDTRIVDVKCEDYDKRNRILLTKTAHGWRAIPRTEMLAVPRASAEEATSASPPPAHAPHHHHHHHKHHHKRRSRKIKNQQSTSVQFPEPESDSVTEPSWVNPENVNIESLLPSHTIQIKRTEDLEKSVNSAPEPEFAQCSTPDKVRDVSPLENLLAVAELELKQHMQSGNWNPEPKPLGESAEEIHDILKSKSDDVQSNSDSKSHECSYNDEDEMSMNDILSRLERSLQSPHGFGSESGFDDEILETDSKFNEENHKSSEDAETKLESEQKKPNTPESNIKEEYRESDDFHKLNTEEDIKEDFNDKELSLSEIDFNYVDCKIESDEIGETNNTSVTQTNPTNEVYVEETSTSETIQKQVAASNEAEPSKTNPHDASEKEPIASENDNTLLPESTHDALEDKQPETDICLDLSMKTKPPITDSQPSEESEEGPTDLCIRKPKLDPPRPPSQNSEAIQSPEPSGIPAVPASPDIVSTTSSSSKPRSAFLESLLVNSMNKLTSNSSESLSKSKEPLDLGHCRKSASPTVTCSEEIVLEPPPMKKLKTDDITLKNLLDKESNLPEQSTKKISPNEIPLLPDTPRLLTLLKASSDTEDPLAEYKQLLQEIDVPNPLMVPKDIFPDLLKHPRREVLKILSGHSNKNVALDDILVVYKDKLLAAIESSYQNSLSNICKNLDKVTAKTVEQNNNVHSSTKSTSEQVNKRKHSDVTNKHSAPAAASPDNRTSLANDIDAANEAAFNPLFWPGCPIPFEAMANYSNHNEFIQALYAASSLPYLPNQLGELHPGLQMMLGNKMTPPPGFTPFSHANINNAFELNMWQEAIMQANMLKNKSPYENHSASHHNHRPSTQKKSHGSQNQGNKSNARLGNNKNISQSQSMIHPAFPQNQSSWQNPYLFQQNGALDTTQFNPFSHKNNLSPPNKPNPDISLIQKKNKEANIFSQYNEQEKRLHQQMMQEHQKMQQQIQQQKLFRQHQHQQQLLQQQMLRQSSKRTPSPLRKSLFSKEHLHPMELKSGVSVPMDLSSVHSIPSKGKSGGVGSGKASAMVTSSRSHMEDIPEVGSTTGSIEDMQDNHAQLWHPLFGSQNKGYNPWNLPSLAALGE